MYKILLAIPTFNESENVISLHKVIRKYNKKINILFIDDNSNDGTINKIKKIINIDKKTFLVVREKKLGIGSAHKFAFKWAYKKRFKFLITMDADFSHDPKIINKMIKIKHKFHVVQTNRFLNKKSLSDWPAYRIVLTNLRYFVLCYLLEIKYDSSGAFRCYNLEKIKLSTLLEAKSNSYSFFWESMYIFCKKKYKIKELSMVQKYRVKGSSKLTIKEWINGLIYVFYIFFTKKLFY